MRVKCPSCTSTSLEIEPGESLQCPNCNYIVSCGTAETLDINAEEPPPVDGVGRPSVDLAKELLDARYLHGLAKYGKAHRHDNGRDHFIDMMQEVLDAVTYGAAELEKRKALKAKKAEMLSKMVGVNDEYNLFSVREIKALLELI